MVSATTWIFRQQHSPEYSPESHLSAFLASVLFFFTKDGPLRLTSIFSQKSLFYNFLLPSQLQSIDTFPLQRFGNASHLYLPLRYEHSVSSGFSRLFLQLHIDLHTTLALFISHNYNFSSSDAARAEPSQTDSAPHTVIPTYTYFDFDLSPNNNFLTTNLASVFPILQICHH